MTNQLSVIIGVVVGFIAGVVPRVGVELRLRLWKLDAVDNVSVTPWESCYSNSL